MEEKAPMKSRTWNGWFLLAVLVLITFLVPVILFFFYSSPEARDPSLFFRTIFPNVLWINVIITHALSFFLLFLFCRRVAWRLVDIGWSTDSSITKEILLGLAFGFLTYFFKELCIEPLEQLLNNEVVEFRVGHTLKGTIDYRLLIVALVFPFVEESIFRGFLFKSFAEKYGKWISIMLICLIFGLLHIGHSPFDFISSFIKWFLWFLLFIWRKNLIGTTAAHMVSNLSTVFIG